MSDLLAENVFDDDDNKSWKKSNAPKASKGKKMQDMITTLHDAAAIGCLSYIVAHWAAGFNIDEVDQFGATLLHWAAMKGHVHLVKFLCDRGADIHKRDQNGQIPLMWAANENRVEVGRVLMSRGCDPRLVDPRGCNSYFISAMCGSLAFLHMLHLCSPLVPDDVDNEQHTILVWAAYKGHLPVVRYLHEQHKVSVIAIDSLKRNAMHWAAREGQTEVCVYLMSAGLSPLQKDSENLSPTEWADQRNHRLTKAALVRNQTTPTPTLTGTITSITSSIDVLYHTLAGVAAVVIHFMIITRWVPTFLTHIFVSIYGSKNMIFPQMYKVPKRSLESGAESTMFDEIGVPKTLVEAMRGIPQMPFRRREQMNLTMFPCFLCVQYVAMSMAGITVPTVYFIASFVALIFAALVKALSFQDVVPRGSALEDPLLKAVESGDDRNACEPRIYPPGYYARIPLRAYHCFELDTYFHKYDGWCLYFDCPIARSNRRFYFIFVLAMAIQQFAVLSTSWSHFNEKVCTAENPFRLCSFLWNIVVSALPCKEATDGSWRAYILPSTTNMLGLWLLQYTFAMFLIFAVTTWRHLICIFYGTTRKEYTEGTAPSTAGGLTSINRNGGIIFSDGGIGLNCLLFLLGKDAQRWTNVGAIPPAPPS